MTPKDDREGQPRRRRMGGPEPTRPTDSVAASVPSTDKMPAAEPVDTGTSTRRRMGSTTPETSIGNVVARRRMGSDPSGTAPHVPASKPPSTTTQGQPPSRSRMVSSASATEESSRRQIPPNDVPPSVADSPSASRSSGRLKRWTLIVLAVLVLLVGAVLAGRGLRSLDGVQAFIERYPGVPTLHPDTPIGIPAWLGWQHFLNILFMTLIVRTGLNIRYERRAPAQITPRKNSLFAPRWAAPQKIGLTQWLHQGLDLLWVVNGLVFMVLLFGTGQWMRIVPVDVDVVPHGLSAALQYVSLDWPAENGWVHYNALQMIAYTVTVFVAAPLAVISGARLSTWWPQHQGLNAAYPVELARAIHLPVMVYFVIFTAVHVGLVAATGLLPNLNHMFTARDAEDAWGLVVLGAGLLAISASWVLTRPVFVHPVAQRFGTLSK